MSIKTINLENLSYTYSVDIPDTHTVYLTPSTQSFSLPQFKAKPSSTINLGALCFQYLYWGLPFGDIVPYAETNWGSNTSGWWLLYLRTISITAADLFTETNKTTRVVRAPLYAGKHITRIYEKSNSGTTEFDWADNNVLLTSVALTLDAPPTFNTTQVSFDLPYVCAGFTTASVTISNAEALYGGDISSATLTIGNHTETITPINGGGTISILLNEGGTFTPVVTVTDSRGQTATTQLNPITVSVKSAPSINIAIARTKGTTGEEGVFDDEGMYTTLAATLTFADGLVNAAAPIIEVKDEDNNTYVPTIVWYSSRNTNTGLLSNIITSTSWSNVSNGDTVYGLISITNGFNTQKSYTISVTPQDSEGTMGNSIAQILGNAFYTVDFLAGGHGIAFGQPASQEGFFCNMDAHFIDYSKVMHNIFDIFYPKGSYYETHLPYTINGHSYDDDNLTNSEIALCGDTWFDPRIAWGGTWILETEGQVHVSAGTNYTVVGALTDTTDGGESTHTLTIDEMPSHRHYASQGTNYGFPTYKHSSGASRVKVEVSGGDRYAWVGSSGASSADASALEWTSSLTTAGNGAAHENMQPYIVVYRWHRTA